MITQTRFYRTVAIILSVALVASLFPQLRWVQSLGADSAYAAASNDYAPAIPESVSRAALSALGDAPLTAEWDTWDHMTGLQGRNSSGVLARSANNQVATDGFINPLSISRVQSAYFPGEITNGSLVVTYTIRNNQLPVNLPQVTASADLTDTVAALQNFQEQKTQDPNTVHNVLLVDMFTIYGDFISAVPCPDQQVGEYAWNLGDIPPLSGITVTMQLNAPAVVVDNLSLDNGAQVWGTYHGQAVSAAACAVTLSPDTVSGEPVAAYLQSAVDADKRDDYIVQRASGLCSPGDAFTYVQGLDYEAYKGSLRGARGTEWSQAGNSLDLSNLLVALLRSNNIPARYQHGTLSVPDAQTLILSMFPTTGPVVGYVPDGAEVSDPANDPALLAEAQDHWWVEAYIGGVWTAMDPSFPQAIVGQTFTTPDEPPLAEVPGAMRHKVTVTLETEMYQSITYLMDGFIYTEPLTYTFTTAELVGNPLTFKQLVNTQRPPFYPTSCGVFCWTHYTYVPYLRVGDSDTLVIGHQYWELLSDFPFGQQAITGAWLHFDVQDAEGNTERFTREVGDRLGAVERLSNNRIRGLIPSLLTAQVLDRFNAGASSLTHELDNYTIYFDPSWMSVAYAAASGDELLAAAPRVLAIQAVGSDIEAALNGETQDISGALLLDETSDMVVDTTQAFNRMMGATYVTLADGSAQDLGETGLVRTYPNSPRITITAFKLEARQTVTETQYVSTQGLDLLHDHLRGIAYPGQAKNAEQVYQMARGMNDTFLEKSVGEMLLAQPGKSAAGILQAAAEQGITLIYADADNLEALGNAVISDEARGRIWQAVDQGYGVLVPRQMVDWNGEEAIAWWQLDLETGEMVGVGEDGTHQFLVEAAFWMPIFALTITLLTILIDILMARWRWKEAIEMTWNAFWEEVVRQASGAGANDPSTLPYQDILQATKAYMNSNPHVWPTGFGPPTP